MASIMRVIAACALLSAAVVASAGPFTPEWASLDTRACPDWYDDAKFGIFIHWGVYSVPAWSPVGEYAEWYWHSLATEEATQAFHNRTYGPGFKYTEFADMFKAELFDADAWADLFQRSGAKYIVPTSKHHEGFTLWPSAQSWNWNAVDVGPKRDLLKEIMSAVRSKGLHAGMYFSLYEWFHPLYIGPKPSQYVDQVMLPQLYDLVNNYQPDVLWTDGQWEHNATFWHSEEFLAWLFNESPVKDTIVINDRWGSETPGVHGGFYTPEYSSTVYSDHKWEENSGIDVHSFGLNRNTPADKYSTATDIIALLVRSVCFGGNLLLDIGPAADGTIPPVMAERLLQVGDWLRVNGEAIYATRTWKVQQEYFAPNPKAFVGRTKGRSNVFAGVPTPGSSAGSVVFLGSAADTASCESLCAASAKCLSYTWHDATTGAWANMCYARTDNLWALTADAGHSSGKKRFYTVSYTAAKTGNDVFAIVDIWRRESIVLPSVTMTQDGTVEMLGVDGALEWSNTPNGLVVRMPQISFDEMPCQSAWAFRLTGTA
eukprot:Opistho-2@90706